MVATMTTLSLFQGKLLFAPCLKEIEGKEEAGETQLAEKNA